MPSFTAQSPSIATRPLARLRRVALGLAGVALTLTTAACDHADFYPATNAYYRPWGGVVQVTRRPPAAYVQLGVVVAHGSSAATESSMIEQMKERAAGMGANVIIVTQEPTVTGHDIFGMPQYEMSALAVRTVR